jgi:adenosylcobyric acid synthase
VILPGTRTTAADLRWLHRAGLAQLLLDAVADPAGPLVLGICGGYQMLGSEIADPAGVESGSMVVTGLGLLDVRTEFAEDKVLEQVRGNFLSGSPLGDSPHAVVGYEIHMGRTCRGPSARPLLHLERVRAPGEPWWDGAVDAAGRVFGTYVHGLFDGQGTVATLIGSLRKRAGLAALTSADWQAQRESLAQRYQRLAEWLRRQLDLDPVYGALGVSTSRAASALSRADATTLSRANP